MKAVKRENEVPWSPHPFLPIQIKNLLSKRDDRADITIFLVAFRRAKRFPSMFMKPRKTLFLSCRAEPRCGSMG